MLHHVTMLVLPISIVHCLKIPGAECHRVKSRVLTHPDVVAANRTSDLTRRPLWSQYVYNLQQLCSWLGEIPVMSSSAESQHQHRHHITQ